MSKKALGKGIGAIFSDSILPDGSCPDEVVYLDVSDIRPNRFQPRKQFSEGELRELSSSIREKGVLQPIVVRTVNCETSSNGAFELVAGERRLRAVTMAGLDTVPAIVRDVPDNELLELAIVENVQRKDLNPMEMAYAYHQMSSDLELTQEEIARKVGKSRPSVANFLRLVTLPDEVQCMVSAGTVSFGHAKLLLSLRDDNKAVFLARKVVEEGLSVKMLASIVDELGDIEIGDIAKQEDSTRDDEETMAFLSGHESRLKELIATRVRIKEHKGKGKIIIDYKSREDLERILALMVVGSQSNM